MLVILRSHDFRTAEQVAAFLGGAPVEKRSGTSVRGRSRMSKIGPPEIRTKLYLAALCGLRFNIAMKSMYERLCLNVSIPAKRTINFLRTSGTPTSAFGTERTC